MKSTQPEPIGKPVDSTPARDALSTPPVVPDLLYEQAQLRIDAETLRDNLPFAFVSGDSNGSIDRALTEMKVKDSGWNPSVYQDELFLNELIEMTMPVSTDSFTAPLNTTYLKRVIATPPRKREDVDFRRQGLVELWENPLLRTHLSLAYRRICHIIVLFDSQGYSGRYDDLERRLEIVSLLHTVIEQISSVPPAQSAAMDRVREFGQSVVHDEAFRQLTEFLDYKEQLASVELHLSVRIDGKIGSFEVQKVAENQRNRFYQSPLRRLLNKLLLFLRGYRFTEMEVIERWIDKVFTATLDVFPPLFQLKGDLELYLVGIAFREYCEARGLSVCLPELNDGPTAPVQITRLFNPLLFAQGIVPVCCDLKTEGGQSMSVITGPNSGGKTRLLQSLAILQLLSQTGLYAPARAAQLRWCTGMFVSLVEGARVDQAEGRLGTEMLRIRRVFEQAGDVSLVIIDELCSGTNPSEGEEIFFLVMTLLKRIEPLVFITTHFLQFAERLQEHNALGLEFLQVELDEKKKPTFGFIPGVAASSLARETAARLGVTQEELVALIEGRAKAT